MAPPIDMFFDVPVAIWAALSGIAGGVGTWFVGLRTVRASILESRDKLAAETLVSDAADRAAFRTALMTEVNTLRAAIKEAHAEIAAMQIRLTSAEAEVYKFRAQNDVLHRWVEFFKRRAVPANDAAGAPDELSAMFDIVLLGKG